VKPATHQVVIHTDAINDLRKYYQRAYDDAPAQSTAWYQRLLKTMKSPERLPDRCPIARESSRVFLKIRELLFGRRPYVFRILFTIDGDVVRVLRIVRAQRRSPSWRSIEQSYFDEQSSAVNVRRLYPAAWNRCR